ncbi:MAG: hypothetical protein IPP29_21720 [Bacteroidetes bacterium]|nr:hypothetical protein [Bacteroidota bacterium]
MNLNMALFIIMKIYKFIIWLLFVGQLQAQKENAVWVFGDSAGIDFNNLASPTAFQVVAMAG